MATTHPKNAGNYYSGGLNASTDMYLLSGIRGPFTPSQWLELEQQALIYKYITANEPIPVQLLIPIINAFNSAAVGFNVFNGGWGPFHLGYPNTGATELGRCRRTDGKKWRCAKDAVPNHKYCEKHIKRRSRKHVEGQGSEHVSRATKSTTTKLMQPTPVGIPGDGSTTIFDINLNHTHHQVNSLQSSATNPTMDAYVNRMHVKRDDNVEGLQELSFLSHAANLDHNESSFSIHKHSLHTFADWPNSQSSSDQLSNLCPGLQSHSPYDITQLSNVSMSTTSSPTNEHLSLRQANWMSISPEASMGGPLGEALQISNSTEESRKTSAE